MSSCGIPRPEPGICSGRTSGRDGWQVGARETPGPRGRKRRPRRGPPGPPPAAAPGSPARAFRARGWAEPAALTPSRPGPARAPALPAPPRGCGFRPGRADSPAGTTRGARSGRRAHLASLPPGGRSAGWPLLRRLPPRE